MKNIVVIAMGQETSYVCREQLQQLLGVRINITDYYVRGGTLPPKIHADFAIFLSPTAYRAVSSRLAADTPWLIARRSINYHEVGKLFTIPPNTDVLLVNDLPESATETIAALQALGIDHLNYSPYAPGMHKHPDIHVAITPGETRFVPASIESIIDIGTRLIDITSLTEILSHLGILEHYADFLSEEYIHDIISVIKKSQDYKVEAQHLKQKIQRLEITAQKKIQKNRYQASYTFADILGQSPELRHAIDIAKIFAETDSTVLIQAESGAGKELFAQSIHTASARRNGPFVAVNFAAITESLLESELFGYVEGSFTGASRHGSPGLFEQAHTGTIFLDEIGDAPLSFQVKLLRVLQEHEVRRIGSSATIPIDVRVIAATNRNLYQMVKEGKFRQDLYYRLKVLPLELPPLHQRAGDVLLLARHFYKKYAHNDSMTADDFLAPIAHKLLFYRWPGNIRELENTMEYLCAICAHRLPTVNDLPRELREYQEEQQHDVSDSPKEAVLSSIAAANRNHTPIGRRSLAQELNLPENQIRQLLTDLVQEGKVIQQRGRGGLHLTTGFASHYGL